MLHLAYKTEFLEPLNWGYMKNAAHRCQILVALEATELDTSFLCNNDKHGLGNVNIFTVTVAIRHRTILNTSLAWTM